MTNDNETTAETTLPATVPAETVQAETTPDASVDAPAPGKAPKAPRKRMSAKLRKAVAASLADHARSKAKLDKEGVKHRANHVAEVQRKVGKRRIVWQGKPLDWPKAAKESGKRAEAILKAAGAKGMSYAEYAGAAGSINRLGYMLRKEAAKLA